MRHAPLAVAPLALAPFLVAGLLAAPAAATPSAVSRPHAVRTPGTTTAWASRAPRGTTQHRLAQLRTRGAHLHPAGAPVSPKVAAPVGAGGANVEVTVAGPNPATLAKAVRSVHGRVLAAASGKVTAVVPTARLETLAQTSAVATVDRAVHGYPVADPTSEGVSASQAGPLLAAPGRVRAPTAPVSTSGSSTQASPGSRRRWPTATCLPGSPSQGTTAPTSTTVRTAPRSPRSCTRWRPARRCTCTASTTTSGSRRPGARPRRPACGS